MKTLIAGLAGCALAVGLAGCGGGEETVVGDIPEEAASAPAEAAGPDTAILLEAAMLDPRRGPGADRDIWRNPAETLAFFGFEADMTVVEIWPGGGWYAQVLAPTLAAGGGTYIAAGFDPASDSAFVQRSLENFRANFVDNPDVYGTITMTSLSKTSEGVAPAGEADLVLSFRNVHNWMAGEFAPKAFADFYQALRPGGVLGVVEHRLPEDREQDPRARSGYVKESAVIALAEQAGFVLEDRAEINANPADTADHPLGVWMLPPSLREPEEGSEAAASYDREAFMKIGESDRMTLRFRKPADADAALLE